VDHPVTTPKDEGQAAARPEVRSRVVAASSVIECTSIVIAGSARGRNSSIDVE
jgi:hypothetical protein